MTHEQIPPSEIAPSMAPVSSEQQITSPEVRTPDVQLAPGQLDALKDYTFNALDKNNGGKHFVTALERMKPISERVGDDLGLGKIAITAAALGSICHNPAARTQSGPNLVKRIHETGIQSEHIKVLLDMQKRFGNKPDVVNIGVTLRSGLSYLGHRKEKYGEDTSQARVAFLASSLAATQDVGLRKIILKELRLA